MEHRKTITSTFRHLRTSTLEGDVMKKLFQESKAKEGGTFYAPSPSSLVLLMQPNKFR